MWGKCHNRKLGYVTAARSQFHLLFSALRMQTVNQLINQRTKKQRNNMVKGRKDKISRAGGSPYNVMCLFLLYSKTRSLNCGTYSTEWADKCEWPGKHGRSHSLWQAFAWKDWQCQKILPGVSRESNNDSNAVRWLLLKEEGTSETSECYSTTTRRIREDRWLNQKFLKYRNFIQSRLSLHL